MTSNRKTISTTANSFLNAKNSRPVSPYASIMCVTIHVIIQFTPDMELANKVFETQSSKSKSSTKSTTRLMFISGETNPLLFLNEFEKCCDLKTDKDKMYKIRHFVDEGHIGKIYFHLPFVLIVLFQFNFLFKLNLPNSSWKSFSMRQAPYVRLLSGS